MFKLIKAVSDNVLDMINAVSNDQPPLILIGATFRKKLAALFRAVNEIDSCLHEG